MSMMYFGFLLLLLLTDALLVRSSIRTRTLKSISGVFYAAFLLVLLYEIRRECLIAFFDMPHALTIQRARLLAVEYFLFGNFFNEVKSYVQNIRTTSL